MSKQAINAFDINQYSMLYYARLGWDDIHHYLTKIDEIDFYDEPNVSAGTQNKNVCAELCDIMPQAETNGNVLHLELMYLQMLLNLGTGMIFNDYYVSNVTMPSQSNR